VGEVSRFLLERIQLDSSGWQKQSSDVSGIRFMPSRRIEQRVDDCALGCTELESGILHSKHGLQFLVSTSGHKVSNACRMTVRLNHARTESLIRDSNAHNDERSVMSERVALNWLCSSALRLESAQGRMYI
jgi:hypothetical protein